MKLLLLALCCASSVNVSAQSRTRTRPQPQPTPVAATVKKELLRVTAHLKEGDPVVGKFIKADAEAVHVEVAGTPVAIRLDQLVSLQFGDAPGVTPLPATASVAPEGALSLEAGIIYKMGGNQPVARTEFWLLDKSLEGILKEAGLPDEKGLGVLTTYAFAVKYPSQYGGWAERSMEAIRPHIVQSVTTDFSGKAQLSGIKPGAYFVAGMSGTRKGFAVWNVSVDIRPGQNTLSLDQNNAATAFRVVL